MKIIGGQPPLSDTLGVLLPDSEEKLILQACLVDGDRAAESWRSWAATRPDIRAALADGGSPLKSLLPLLHFALTQNRVALDESTLAVLRAGTIWEERRAERVREILAESLSALANASITPILLNGVALAETVYPRPSLRHCHDIDFLVSAADISRAWLALSRCGISAAEPRGMRHSVVGMVHADGLPINLRLSLLSGNSYSIPESEMRSRAIAVNVVGQSAKVLTPMDMLLHLCGRFREGAFPDPMGWVTDAACLIKRARPTDSDWSLLVRIAQSSGLSLPLFVMLSYLRSEIAVIIPDEVLNRIAAQARRSPAMHRDAALAGARKGRSGRLSAMIRRSSWRSRLEIVRFLILPSRDFLQSWCDDRGLHWSPIWYVARPLRRLVIRAGPVRKTAKGRPIG